MTQEQFLNHIIPLQPTMQLLAERLLNSVEEAEDEVQDLVVTLWTKRNQLHSIDNLEGYAMQALRNRCISRLRQRKPTIDIHQLCDISDDEARQEASLIEERAAQLDSLMARLPEAQRKAVTMRYIDGLSHSEMQQRLHMSSSNVYTTLSRALSTLKTMLNGR